MPCISRVLHVYCCFGPHIPARPNECIELLQLLQFRSFTGPPPCLHASLPCAHLLLSAYTPPAPIPNSFALPGLPLEEVHLFPPIAVPLGECLATRSLLRHFTEKRVPMPFMFPYGISHTTSLLWFLSQATLSCAMSALLLLWVCCLGLSFRTSCHGQSDTGVSQRTCRCGGNSVGDRERTVCSWVALSLQILRLAIRSFTLLPLQKASGQLPGPLPLQIGECRFPSDHMLPLHWPYGCLAPASGCLSCVFSSPRAHGEEYVYAVKLPRALCTGVHAQFGRLVSLCAWAPFSSVHGPGPHSGVCVFPINT